MSSGGRTTRQLNALTVALEKTSKIELIHNFAQHVRETL